MTRTICAMAIVTASLFPLLTGCARHPLTESEFKGFCYTIIDRKGSCDTIDLCNTFAADVLSKNEPSRQACETDCDGVYSRLYETNWFIGCAPMLLSATNWCHQYCMDNYPK